MALLLPPIPNDPIGETHSWREWFRRINTVLSNPALTIYHNLLAGLQGGTTNDYQHLTTSRLKWGEVKESITAGEVCTIDAGYQLIISNTFTVNGTLNNNGTLVVIQ